MGILSQLLIHHLYLAVFKPLEDREYEREVEDSSKLQIDFEEIEEIEDVMDATRKEEKKENLQEE